MKSYTFNNGTYTHTVQAENTSQAWIGLADKVDCTSDYTLTDISASCENKEHHNLKGEEFSHLSLLTMVGDDEPAIFNHIEGLHEARGLDLK